MLILNETDIQKAVSPDLLLDAIASAMLMEENRQCFVPPRLHANYRDNTLLAMPAITPEYSGAKIISLCPQNPSRGLPMLNGVMLLNNGETGEPLALLNAGILTALRTGAVGATALRALTPTNLRVLGLIGAGTQGRSLALFATHVRPFSRLLIHDANPQQAESLALFIKTQRPLLDIITLPNPTQLVQQADAIITATPSLQPVIPNDPQLLRGKHFIGVGSYKPSMREFPDALFPLLDAVWVDTPHAASESGDLIHPLENHLLDPSRILPLATRLRNMNAPCPETSLFKSVGLALFDLCAAAVIHQQALHLKLGQDIPM